MSTSKHAALGALVAVAPDVLLATFGWRKTWLDERHPLVRGHRFLHSSASLPLIVGLAWSSHLIADHYSTHRTQP